VTSELRLERTLDGSVWTTTATPYKFWERYLQAFDEVRVIARLRNTNEPASAWRRADGPGVSFSALPYYVGTAQYLRKVRSVRRCARSAVREGEAIIMRVSSIIASSLNPLLQEGRPYGLEVVGDPHDVFAPGSVRHAFRPLVRTWLTRQLQNQCRYATAVAYVTERTLQQRYPPAPGAFVTHYSSVELADDAFTIELKRYRSMPGQKLRIVSVGSMEQPYKGFDDLIDSTAAVLKRGLPLELILIGDGRYRQELEKRAARLGIAACIHFKGTLPGGKAVRDELDSSCLFVLASKTEGLPRAMIEAMARGLPCVGSSVGGIPELLSSDELFPSGDIRSLTDKIESVLRNPERMNCLAEQNVARARDYNDRLVNARRRQLLEFLRARTGQWWKGKLAA
jgi:glycosyltransferase involved in cell wall biosynthesis